MKEKKKEAFEGERADVPADQPKDDGLLGSLLDKLKGLGSMSLGAKGAPEFDPSQPFEPVVEFDPSQPFEVPGDEAPPARSLGTKLKDFGSQMVSEALAPVANVVTTPLVELDKLTGAPPRAAMGAIQRGEGFSGAGSAFVDQLQAGSPSLGAEGGLQAGAYLPTTPTGEEIAQRGMEQGGIEPEYAKHMAPAMGALTEGALDVTHIIPGKAISGVIKGAENMAAKGILRAGAMASMGTLPYEKALAAAKRLKAAELIFPGSKDFGYMQQAMKDVGEARAALQANKISVPGSHAVALDAIKLIEANRGRLYGVGTANADALLEGIRDKAFEAREIVHDVPATMADVQMAAQDPSILLFDTATNQPFVLQPGPMNSEGALASALGSAQQAMEQGRLVKRQVYAEHAPKDLTIDELDDLTGILDTLVYTPAGNQKGLNRIWGPGLRKTRAELDASMQTVPEGQLFKRQKTRQADLMTAAKGRRAQTLVGMGIIGGSTLGDVISDGELSITPAAIIGAAMLPQTYMKMVGALKIPGEMARTLLMAHETGKGAAMRAALTKLSVHAPLVAERVIRGTVLLAGKPAAQQYITPEEAETLGKTRIFDPAQIEAEKDRLRNDKSMPSTMRAKALSDIHRNGYVTMEGKEPTPEPEAMAPEPGEAQPDIESLLKAIKVSKPPETGFIDKLKARDSALPQATAEQMDPMSQPIPWGEKAKGKFESAIEKNILNPVAERGHPDLAAALATVPAVFGDLLIPTESGDLAAMPPGWKVIKGGGEAVEGAAKAELKSIDGLGEKLRSMAPEKPIEPAKIRGGKEALERVKAETTAAARDGKGFSKIEKLQRDLKAVEDGAEAAPTSAFEKYIAKFDGSQTSMRRYVEKSADGSEPYFGYAIENPAWVQRKGDMARLPSPVPADFKPIDPKGHLGKGVAAGKADPFSWMESKYGVSKKVLEEHAGKPLKISTRSDLIAHDDYLELLDPKLHEVEFHVFSDNARMNRVAVPGGPSVRRIMTAVERLQERGIKVTLVHDVVKGVPEEFNALRPFILKQESAIKKLPPIRENVIEPEGDSIFKALGIKPEDP